MGSYDFTLKCWENLVDPDSVDFMIFRWNVTENERCLVAHFTGDLSSLDSSTVDFDLGQFYNFKLKSWEDVTKIICWETVSIKVEFILTM